MLLLDVIVSLMMTWESALKLLLSQSATSCSFRMKNLESMHYYVISFSYMEVELFLLYWAFFIFCYLLFCLLSNLNRNVS